MSASVEGHHADIQLPQLAELTIWQRGFAAGVASLISSLTLNPLDVVKTRMQAKAGSAPASAAPPAGSSALRYVGNPVGLTAAWFNSEANSAVFSANRPLVRIPPQQQTYKYSWDLYRSSFDGLYKIARHEGLQTLWRGTDAAVLMTVPLVAIYLPLYDHLLRDCSNAGAGAYAPLVAGSMSRAVAGFITAPLELARVRLQVQQQGPNGSAASGLGILRQLAGPPDAGPLRRITSMWTGIGASLAKDVPFAALYWSLLEPLRGLLMKHDCATLVDHWQNGNLNSFPVVPDMEALPRSRTSTEIFMINIMGAGAAASVAAVVTTPFDVVKTQQQTAVGKPANVWQTLVGIHSKGGMRALFAGAGPRTARTAAGYAIVTSLFEVFKSWASSSIAT